LSTLSIFRLRECDFPFFHVSHDCNRCPWLVGMCFLAGYSEYEFESRGCFRKTSSIISFLLQRNVVHSGSSNQLSECIIKHDDLVPFAQRIVWIKVFCRGAKDRSWLVELYCVKLKFLKNFKWYFLELHVVRNRCICFLFGLHCLTL
jgi:hypothetical protein